MNLDRGLLRRCKREHDKTEMWPTTSQTNKRRLPMTSNNCNRPLGLNRHHHW